ncbi:UPF0488 protein CG14286 [Anastrepha obliqua]|uniref:UPF0488 protein CG14286 n=1 Tax=Anastrepha obliqua TaxID=95512 RepID=UPI00240987D3|nr:UPF0488 protein CG14286 [Anastrepha obliqua]
MRRIQKSKSLQKPPQLVAPRKETPENEAQMELELCWCVQQLENALNSNKLSQKVAADTVKNLRVLKSSTAPFVKKRQVMKAALGDYRGKMLEEEKKIALAAKQIKFTQTIEANKKSSFLKKSAIMQTDKEFRFNFLPPQTDNTSEPPEIDVKNTTASEIEHESSTFISKNLNLNTGNCFKFNFVIDEENNDLNLNGLSIKC